MKHLRTFITGILLAVFMLISAAGAQELILTDQVVERVLDNGLKVLMVKRPQAPLIRCILAYRVGSVNERPGITGISHFHEHMMFKGTKNFGTLDFEKDEALQKRIETAYQVILQEEEKRHPSPGLIKDKRAEMEALRVQVQKIYVPQAFS